jgi:hypothetical protein
VPAKVHQLYLDSVEQLRRVGRDSRPVDPSIVEPFLGYYEGGYRLVFANHQLSARLGPRVLPLQALRSGGYVISGGAYPQNPVNLTRDLDGTPRMELVGLETVRRTVGFG